MSAPRIVVIGAGFAGIEVARGLGRFGLKATLIDRQNHHLFQPLLYQVATAALSPADIAEPIRKMLRREPSVEVILGEVTGIDPRARTVALGGARSIAYDILVLATGATHGYFGHDEWEGVAPGLKTIEDARRIRSRLLLAFERAEMSEDQALQKRLMTIAVIGGGPTGVELAGSIAELARYTLSKDFHRIRAETATVLLLEAAPRILNAFPESLAAYATRKLARLGVTVRTSSPVESIAAHSISRLRSSGECVFRKSITRLIGIAGLGAIGWNISAWANASEFRGPGWYVRDPYIVDIVYEGPFATKDKCLAAANAEKPAIRANGKKSLAAYYCSYLTGPV